MEKLQRQIAQMEKSNEITHEIQKIKKIIQLLKDEIRK
jgi:hypothetical protein